MDADTGANARSVNSPEHCFTRPALSLLRAKGARASCFQTLVRSREDDRAQPVSGELTL